MSNLKPYYSTVELTIIFQRKYNTVSRIMKRLNIPKEKIGKTVVYYLSDILENAPKLYKSMQEAITFSDNIDDVDDE